MKRWSFVIEVKDWNKIKSEVETKAKEAVSSLGSPNSERAVYKVTAIFYQKKDRWLKDDPLIPRQDWGIDLDNVLKQIFDGLGPIIGYRKAWTGDKKYSGVYDANIVEVYAKKLNSGSDKEFLSIEVELLYLSETEENNK